MDSWEGTRVGELAEDWRVCINTGEYYKFLVLAWLLTSCTQAEAESITLLRMHQSSR